MYFLLLFVLYIGVLSLIFIHKRAESIPTASGAIVMAMGIMLIGVIQKIPIFSLSIGISLVIVLFCIFGAVVSLILIDLNKGTFFNNHIKDPINSFSIGTWVAAHSVIILNLHYYFPRLVMPSIFFYCIALSIWLVYLVIITRNYILYIRNPEYIVKLHGGILLSCVATQSLVIAGMTIFTDDFPKVIEQGMLGIGFIFYIIGLGLILLSLKKGTTHHNIRNWKNTNCIIHGALSITGLALCTTMQSLGVWLIYIWMVVSIIFCIVECIELMRGIMRVKLFGVKNGLFVYHPTQWARNFTFGMYVNFTIHLPDLNLFANARYMIVEIGKYIVVILFMIEIWIFMKNAFVKSIS